MAENETPQAQPQSEPAPAASAAPPESVASAMDSLTFSRCATCAHADEVNAAAGTLVCKKYNMCINAEADEIPDDCVEFEGRT